MAYHRERIWEVSGPPSAEHACARDHVACWNATPGARLRTMRAEFAVSFSGAQDDEQRVVAEVGLAPCALDETGETLVVQHFGIVRDAKPARPGL